MKYGFTDEVEQYERVLIFRDAAVADGWSIEPTYQTESVERASRLHKAGFTMQVLSRTKVGEWNYEAMISIWGPDDLAIKTPSEYDWDVIKQGLRTCNTCGETNVDTRRYSFAGRCCDKCLPEMQKLHESGNWTA